MGAEGSAIADAFTPETCEGSVEAGFKGALNGVTDLFGMGGIFLQPDDKSKEVEAKQKELNKVTNDIRNEIDALVQKQVNYLTNETNQGFAMVQETQKKVDEIQDEKIETNQIFIYTLAAVCLVMFIYELFA